MKITKHDYKKDFEIVNNEVIIPKCKRKWAKRNTFALDIDFIKRIFINLTDQNL